MSFSDGVLQILHRVPLDWIDLDLMLLPTLCIRSYHGPDSAMNTATNFPTSLVRPENVPRSCDIMGDKYVTPFTIVITAFPRGENCFYNKLG